MHAGNGLELIGDALEDFAGQFSHPGDVWRRTLIRIRTMSNNSDTKDQRRSRGMQRRSHSVRSHFRWAVGSYTSGVSGTHRSWSNLILMFQPRPIIVSERGCVQLTERTFAVPLRSIVGATAFDSREKVLSIVWTMRPHVPAGR